MAKVTYYELLGVAENADDDEIKRAYRKLAMKHHPDRNPGNKKAEEDFKEGKKAYEILSDPAKRAEYDGKLSRRHSSSFGTSSANGWSAGPTRNTASAPKASGTQWSPPPPPPPPPVPPGANLSTTIQVPIDIARNGGELKVSFKVSMDCPSCLGQGTLAASTRCASCAGLRFKPSRTNPQKRSKCRSCQGHGRKTGQPCKACKKKGAVTHKREAIILIPPNVTEGSVIRLRGAGAPSTEGGANGNLLCTVSLKPVKGLELKGLNVHGEVKVDFLTAMLGGTATYEYLGRTIHVAVPSMCRAGAVIKVAGAGFPDRSTSEIGELRLKVAIDLPKGMRKPTPSQAAFLREMFR